MFNPQNTTLLKDNDLIYSVSQGNKILYFNQPFSLSNFYAVSSDFFQFFFDFATFPQGLLLTNFLALKKFLFFKLGVIIILLRASREDTELNYIMATVLWWLSHTYFLTNSYATEGKTKSNLSLCFSNKLFQESRCL